MGDLVIRITQSNVFGNTIYSASIVVAVFMLGFGVGSSVAGVWADRRYARGSRSIFRAYRDVELTIGLLGALVAVALPRLGAWSAAWSSLTLTTWPTGQPHRANARAVTVDVELVGSVFNGNLPGGA